MPLTVESSGDIVVKIPRLSARPYEPLRSSLYTVEELMEGWDSAKKSLDERISDYYNQQGCQVPKDSDEALCQRIHDHHIDRSVLDFVNAREGETAKSRKIIGIMGGHVEDRTSKYYGLVASVAYQLTKLGYCILTGGGPGVMEAGNLGAYMSSFSASDLTDAISILADAPKYPKFNPSDPQNAAKRKQYIEAALKVRQKYPKGNASLGIPTWAYADEPTGQFATHIAKYFANNIREDGLLAVAVYGVIFAPGGAGTSQEIFQDAVHNSYLTFNSRGPMLFLGSDVYRRSPSLYDVVLAAATVACSVFTRISESRTSTISLSSPICRLT